MERLAGAKLPVGMGVHQQAVPGAEPSHPRALYMDEALGVRG